MTAITRQLPRTRQDFKNWLIIAIAVLSIAYTLYDWSQLKEIQKEISNIAYLGGALLFTEACFIIGALIMAATITEVVAELKQKSWLRRLQYVRTHVRQLAHSFLKSKVFGFGFWLNFTGAVGTTVILAVGVIMVLPVGSWLLLVLLAIDLIATLGWRVPVQLQRRNIMKKESINVRNARRDDIDYYLQLQAQRWEEDNRATKEQLLSRYSTYPEGMLVAEMNGKVVGMVYAMKIRSYDYDNPPSWNEITNHGMCDNHDPDGTIIFGVDLSTAKGVGGLAGDKLLVGIAQLAIREGAKYGMLGGRMPGYHKYQHKMSADEYLFAKNPDGSFLDPQVEYYTGVSGLKMLKALPDYFDDPDSANYGVLLRWRNPFYGWPFPRLWGMLFPLLFKLEEAYMAVQRRRQSAK